jgi:hypothetical protein
MRERGALPLLMACIHEFNNSALSLYNRRREMSATRSMPAISCINSDLPDLGNEHDFLHPRVYDTINLVSRAARETAFCSGELMKSGSNSVLPVCPGCGMAMRFFESFPAQSGLPEVDVFACDACESMVLHDRTCSFPTPGPTAPSS